MKYLKHFEQIEYVLDKNKFFYNYSLKIDDLDFYVRFLSTVKNGVYIRRYNQIHQKDEKWLENYGNPKKIISKITEITQQFILDAKPKCIVIPHKAMKNEIGELETLNKRARINYLFLKDKIRGYKLKYFNTTYNVAGEKFIRTQTYCLIIKDGYSLNPEELLNKKFVEIEL